MWLLVGCSIFLIPTVVTDYPAHRPPTPVVCWHGVNDDFHSCDPLVAALGEDRYTVRVQLGRTAEEDQWNSWNMEMGEQVRPVQSK